jgi:phage antirepressor YoqD-like protein
MWKIEKLVNKGDYLYCVVKDHPKRTKNNYVLYHRIVMENHLNRLLTDNEVIHHIDNNKKNNDISNLQLMNNKEHNRLHSTKGRTMITLICPNCKKEFIKEKRQTHLIKGGNPSCCSRHCRGKLYN